MHRAIRIVRGTVRKWRENEVPSVAGEEVRKKQENRKDKFVPPRYTINDAIGWTAGLVITYEIVHRRDRNLCSGVVSAGASKKCPFSLTEAVNQPLGFSTAGNNVISRQKKPVSRKAPSAEASRKRTSSIDVSPFLHEHLLDSDYQPSDLSDDDDSDVSFCSPDQSKLREPKLPEKPQDSKLLAYAENLVGTTLGVLGALEYLRGPRKPVQPITDPPLTAMELLKKGEQYTSGRALYNLGVAYDRQKDPELAREYYKRASDLGHPLATYNYGILILRDGKINEGLELMKFSAARGVREAQTVINDLAPAKPQ